MSFSDSDLLLVTGATGLVGSHVAQRLRQRGLRVRALARSSADITLLRDWGVEIAAGDLTDAASLTVALTGVTGVIHCAAKVGDWGPVEEYRQVNVEGTRALLDAALAAGSVRRFVQISSLGVYAARDHYGTDETEPPSTAGIDGYTKTKAESELLALGYAARGLPVVALRPGFIYGPRDRTVLPKLLARLRDGSFRYLGSGQQLMNNTFVDNVVVAVLRAFEVEAAVGQAFNITDPQLVTKRVFVGGLARRAGLPEPTRRVPLPVAKVLARAMETTYRLLGKREAPLLSGARIKFLGLNLDYSIDKARDVLGYDPAVTFEQGMDRTVAWLKEAGLA